MESFYRHNLESHRSSSSFAISKIHSPRNLITKGLPSPDSNEPSLHHSQSQINQNSTFIKGKKEFLPFLNERDGLNRLITVPISSIFPFSTSLAFEKKQQIRSIKTRRALKPKPLLPRQSIQKITPRLRPS